MILESLLTLVETLRKHVDDHGDALRQSEALTRYVLIDPLLRELGWNTADPDMVRPEFSASGGWADYALHNNGKLVMMLEAKKLDTDLRDAVSQGITYCLEKGTKYFSVTDGIRWEIYETHKPVPIDDKRIISFDLKGTSVAEACLKAMTLWRPGVISGHVQVGQTPIVGLPDEQTSITKSQPTQETSVQPPSPDTDDKGWQPLSELNPQKGDSAPTEILFPDGKSVSIKTWKAILVEVVRWLIDNNKLNELNERHRTVSMGPTRYLVSTSPKHSNGTAFHNAEKIGSFYIETSLNKKAIAQKVRHIIEYVGQDPAQFKVR